MVKIWNDIDESNHALKFFLESNYNGNMINTSVIPWLLMQQQTDAIYEAIKKTKFPIGFAANISSLISKKGDFGSRLKMHDWHTFVKVSHDWKHHVLLIVLFYNILKISFYYYSNAFYLYLSHTTLTTWVSNKLYMILENTWV